MDVEIKRIAVAMRDLYIPRVVVIKCHGGSRDTSRHTRNVRRVEFEKDNDIR